MLKETQNIEFKSAWRDEHLKWICGFANAQGGSLFVGIDDNGCIVGLENAKKLSEDIPNKVRDVMGLVVDVNVCQHEDKDYLEIKVRESQFPVSCRGEFYYRSGATNQLLQGNMLTQFIMQKTGFKWDAVTVGNVSATDLDAESFEIFKYEALRSGRMTTDDFRESREELLSKLGIVSDGKLTRAAILLFHKNPEKWVGGSYIKIGYFETDADLRYQDEIHGSLFVQADRILDLIFTKYLKAEIWYDKETRIETFPFAREAVREAVYNALVHKNYADCNPIQISVYADKMYIANDCIFPSDWTAADLMNKHSSRRFNPNIANGFFRSGLIEAWGRGIEKMCAACKSHNAPEPQYLVHSNDIMILFKASEKYLELANNKATENHPENCTINCTINCPEIAQKTFAAIVENPNTTIAQLMETNQLSERAVKYHIKLLKENGLIKHIGSNKTGYWKVVTATKKHSDDTEKTPENQGDNIVKECPENDSKVTENYPGNNRKTTQKTTENYPENDQKTTQKILESIKSNPKISRKGLAEICGISSNGIKWQLKQLQAKGRIRRIGSDRGGHWEVIEK